MSDPRATPLRCVLLDVGGTLLEERPSRFAIYARVAREYGLEVEPDRMRSLMREAHDALPEVLDGAYRYSDPWFRAFIARIFGGLGLGTSGITDLTEELFRRFESTEHFVPYPGALELLRAVRERGARLGVVSNWSARLPRLLASLGLDRYFDFVLSSATEGCEKPDPRIFERALELAGTPASSTVHVGDHPRKDAAGARAVGIEPILIDHGAAPVEAAESADAPARRYDVERVTDFGELQALIVPRIP